MVIIFTKNIDVIYFNINFNFYFREGDILGRSVYANNWTLLVSSFLKRKATSKRFSAINLSLYLRSDKVKTKNWNGGFRLTLHSIIGISVVIFSLRVIVSVTMDPGEVISAVSVVLEHSCQMLSQKVPSNRWSRYFSSSLLTYSFTRKNK